MNMYMMMSMVHYTGTLFYTDQIFLEVSCKKQYCSIDTFNFMFRYNDDELLNLS